MREQRPNFTERWVSLIRYGRSDYIINVKKFDKPSVLKPDLIPNSSVIIIQISSITGWRVPEEAGYDAQASSEGFDHHEAPLVYRPSSPRSESRSEHCTFTSLGPFGG
ncbi:hypothetical protein ACU8KH_05608 [Lachancea thermotolerans]